MIIIICLNKPTDCGLVDLIKFLYGKSQRQKLSDLQTVVFGTFNFTVKLPFF